MNRVYSVLLALCLLVLACDDKSKPKKPDNLISKDKMEKILYDLYIVNSAKGVNKKALERFNVVPERYILTKYGIDSLQFAESNNYYAFDTDAYKAMVGSIKSRLEKEKEHLEALKKKEAQAAKRKRDSINKAKTQKDSSNKIKIDLKKDVLLKGKEALLKSKKETSKN